MGWFRKKNNADILQWPDLSSNTNSMENLPYIVHKKLTKYCLEIANKLKQLILKLWSEISNETYPDIVELMLNRINTYIRVKWDTFAKY